MRLVVIHDSEGTIISLTAIPPNGLSTGKVLKPGEYMTELEAMEIMLNLDEEDDEAFVKYYRQLQTRYFIKYPTTH